MTNLAIEHGVGHAIGQEKNQPKADDDGEASGEGRIPDCGEDGQTQNTVICRTLEKSGAADPSWAKKPLGIRKIKGLPA